MLPDWQIRLLVNPPLDRPDAGRVVFMPVDLVDVYGPIADSQIQPCSLDVRLGPDFIAPFSLRPEGEEVGLDENLGYTMLPGECVLAYVLERFSMPDNLVGEVKGKSSWARKFLTIEEAGLIDPGFSGDITLELKNDGYEPLQLRPGMVIAQVCFHALDAPAARPYGTPGLNSHYQGQTGPTRSRL